MEPATTSRQLEAALLPHLDSAWNLARWLARNDADAWDITQESYARAIRFFPTLQGDAKPWLLSIVRNTFYSWAHRNGSRRTEPLDEDEHAGEADMARGPELLSILHDDLGRVRKALEALPDEFREAIVLRELEGLSYQDIADAAGVPIGTVMSRLSRARARVQRLLALHEGEER
ncbi:MAG TPA: sigma-70 family RNA polymerase sigma factor [Candidatus Binatia bacterium]|jgi:RNA polymerase sigma-70 factor (ECF subfamily)